MILEVENLSFAYDKQEIFRELSFKVESPSVLAILGPNGIGKTTLINCILRLKKYSNGKILVDDKDINDYKDYYSVVSYLKQGGKESSIYTVKDTVLLGLSARINPLLKPSAFDIEKVEEILNKLKIYHLKDKYVSKLSGGEAQMVFMARALVKEPQMLVLDEPESNLDYRNQLLMLDTIDKLCAEGKLIIFNTHYPEHALRYSNKTLIMSSSYKYKFGNTKEIITKENIEEAYAVKVAVGEVRDGNEIYSDIIPIRATM